MQQAIQQRGGERRILGKGGVPLPERQVAGHNQAALFIACRDHLEKQVCLLPVHWQVANLVNNQQAVSIDRPVHDDLQLVLC